MRRGDIRWRVKTKRKNDVRRKKQAYGETKRKIYDNYSGNVLYR